MGFFDTLIQAFCEVSRGKGNRLEDKILLEQFKIAADARTAIGHESWVVFSIFCASNAVLLNALFQSVDFSFLSVKWIVIPIAGLILSGAWYRIEERLLKWQEFYEGIVDCIERELEINEIFRTGKGNSKLEEKVSGNSIRPLMTNIPFLAIIAWSIMLGIGICIGFRLIVHLG